MLSVAENEQIFVKQEITPRKIFGLFLWRWYNNVTPALPARLRGSAHVIFFSCKDVKTRRNFFV